VVTQPAQRLEPALHIQRVGAAVVPVNVTKHPFKLRNLLVRDVAPHFEHGKVRPQPPLSSPVRLEAAAYPTAPARPGHADIHEVVDILAALTPGGTLVEHVDAPQPLLEISDALLWDELGALLDQAQHPVRGSESGTNKSLRRAARRASRCHTTSLPFAL